MIVAVTGVTSYLGRRLLPLLEADPQVERVIGLGRRPAPPGDFRKLTHHQLDVRSPQVAEVLAGVDVVAHLAFVVMLTPGEKEADDINIAGSRNVCQAAARAGAHRLVFTSSVVTYGFHADNPIPLTEAQPLRVNPGLYYNRAKIAVERYLDELAVAYPQLVITRLRPCTIAGPHADPRRMANLVANPLLIPRGWAVPLQIVHEDDVAQALHLAITRDLPGAYNVTPDDALTLPEIARLYRRRVVALPLGLLRVLMGLLWRLRLSVFAPEWLVLAQYPIVADNARLRAAGWQPRYTTADTLAILLSRQREGAMSER